MKKFLQDFLKLGMKSLITGMGFVIGVGIIVYGATQLTEKNEGDSLKLGDWNEVVNAITELQEKVFANNGGGSTGGQGNGGLDCHALDISDKSTSTANIAGAISGCRDMEGGNWRLPTVEELSCFISTKPSEYVWTRSLYHADNNYYNYWVILDLSNGHWSYNISTGNHSYYCVR